MARRRRGSLLAMVAGVVAAALAGCSTPTESSPTSTGLSPTPPGSSTNVVVAERSVTTGPGIPDTSAIDDAALASVGSGWSLALFDTGTFDERHNPLLGARLLYLISPEGERYQAGYYSPIRGADLLAWNVGRDTVFLRFNGSELGVFDLVSGRQLPTWQPCGISFADVGVTPRDDGTWEIRGSCNGTQLDGVYEDDGTPVDDPSFSSTTGGPAAGVDAQPAWLQPDQPADHFWGVSGTVGLFSSGGSLWTYDSATSTTVPLIEVDPLATPEPVIGVALTRSLIAP